MTETDPVRVPVVVGVNVTDMVQLLPLPASIVLHGVVPPATAAKSPLAANESDVLAVPVFLTVTIFAALVVPTVCAANVSLVGVTVTITVPAEAPVPERLTVCGEFEAESVTEIVPESDPVAVGAKVALTVQLTPAFNVAGETGQLLVWPKFVLAAIETVVLPVPVFFTVMGWLALVVPTA